MKKYSKLALILAMMIGVSSTMTACGPKDPDNGDGNSNYLELEEKANNAVYKTRIDEWLKYVEYDKEEVVDKNVNSTAFTQKDTELVKTTISIKEHLYEQVETTKVYKDTELAQTTKKVGIFLKESNKEVVTLTQKIYAVKDDALIDDTKTMADQVEYNVSYLDFLVKVEKINYKLKEATQVPGEEPVAIDATKVSNYEAVKTYTYYVAKTGEVFLENLSAEENQTVVINGNLVDALDKTYIFADGEMAKEFPLDMEYVLPTFNKGNQQIYYNNYDEYVYFEQGEYGYRIDEEQYLQGQQVGDLVMVTYPGLSIRVYKDYEMVAMYETKTYHVAGYVVLPNGNVYICEYKLLDNDATTFDFKMENLKFKVVNTLLNVKTGTTQEITSNNFVASRMYSNVTKEINTTLNRNTVLLDADTFIEGMRVKDGYILAEVQNYKDGVLEGNTSFVVLDAETLEQVASLPKIVPAQFGYLGFVSENEMLLNTRTTDNKIIRYTANTQDGDLELFTKGNVTLLENDAFLYDNCVYDYDWNEIECSGPYYGYGYQDYVEKYGQPQVLSNGKLLFKEAGSYSTLWYLGQIVDINESIMDKETNNWVNVTKKVLSIQSVYGYNYSASNTELRFNGVCYELYVNGSLNNFIEYTGTSTSEMFNLNNETKEIYEADGSGSYVRYDIYKRIASKTELADGTLLVCVAEDWDADEGHFYDGESSPSDEVMKYDGKTYYQYYIIK